MKRKGMGGREKGMITMVNPLSGLHSIRVIELVFCNGAFHILAR